MILANLTKAIRSQNWFAVGIEFLIVVAGVFIGIQVSNWNEERAERLTERQILSDIATDLRSDLEELRNGLDYAERRIGVAHFLLDEASLPKTERVVFPGQSAVLSDSFDEAMREGQPPGERVRGRLWSQVVLSYYPTPSTAALETVTGAGLLGLIRDEGLVRDLQLYTQLIEGLIDTQNRSFRPVRNEIILLGQRYGLSAYGEVPDDTLIALVADHEEIAATLRTSAELAHIHALLLQRMIEQADEILSQIESRAEAAP